MEGFNKQGGSSCTPRWQVSAGLDGNIMAIGQCQSGQQERGISILNDR